MSPGEGSDHIAAPAGKAVHLPAPAMTVLGGLVLMALAGWLWVDAANIEDANLGLMGPAGFPRAAAALLGSCSAVMVGQAVHSMFSVTPQAPIRIKRPLAVLSAIVLVALYPLLVTQLGYYIGTTIWLAPFLFLAGMRSPIGIGVATAGFLLFVKVLFQMVLATPLPQG